MGVYGFGAPAPGGTGLDNVGFNAPNVVSCAKRCLKGEAGVLSVGTPGGHWQRGR